MLLNLFALKRKILTEFNQGLCISNAWLFFLLVRLECSLFKEFVAPTDAPSLDLVSAVLRIGKKDKRHPLLEFTEIVFIYFKCLQSRSFQYASNDDKISGSKENPRIYSKFLLVKVPTYTLIGKWQFLATTNLNRAHKFQTGGLSDRIHAYALLEITFYTNSWLFCLVLLHNFFDRHYSLLAIRKTSSYHKAITI